MAEQQLPPDALPRLREGKKKLTEFNDLLSKAKIAGFDVGSFEKRGQELGKMMNKVRDGFFPNETL